MQLPYRTKDKSVNIINLHPIMLAALPVIGRVISNFLGYTAVITSGCDGVHSGLFHHIGCATDWRIWKSTRDSKKISKTRKLELAGLIQTALDERFGRGVFRVYTDHDTHLHIDLKGTNRKPVQWDYNVWVKA